MTLPDLISTSFGNLARMRLRATLTIAGVVIAVGTFVAMLSFGAGNQLYVSEQFEKLGLLHTMQAFPLSSREAADSVKVRSLDDSAIAELQKIPGVRLVFPFDAMTTSVSFRDTTISIRTQAVSLDVLQTKWFALLSAGEKFTSDAAKKGLVTSRFLREFDVKDPDSVIGKQIVLTVQRSSLDSGIAQLFPPDREYLRERIKEITIDSFRQRDYLTRLLKTEANRTVAKFLEGFTQHRETVRETLTVCGVLRAGGPQERVLSPLFIPVATSEKLSSGFSFDDPSALFATLQSGNLFPVEGTGNGKNFSKVTLDVEPTADQKMIGDSIKALGFRSFSFAEQFEEIKKFFIYFDLGLAIVGLIALVTASLGIINTLVMSVLERRREIGVMKSIGADERDIRNLFLTESGIIGFVGSLLGIALGWGVSRVISFVAQTFMQSEGIDPLELFALPYWLVFAAIALGTSVSLLAGLYPAARAARVDPVEALRGD